MAVLWPWRARSVLKCAAGVPEPLGLDEGSGSAVVVRAGARVQGVEAMPVRIDVTTSDSCAVSEEQRGANRGAYRWWWGGQGSDAVTSRRGVAEKQCRAVLHQEEDDGAIPTPASRTAPAATSSPYLSSSSRFGVVIQSQRRWRR
jgi:hypothetical protein